MRAFKKLMAGAIAMAIAATMATSAFAAGFDATTGKVTAEYTAAGQTTVLIVPADVWVNNAITGLEDSDILYINQYEDAATANTAIAAGFGVKLNEEGKLDEGDYYALFGGTTEDGFAITAVAFNVSEESEVTVMYGDADNSAVIDVDDVVSMIKVLGGATLDSFNTIAADVDGSGTLDVDDVVLLIKYLGGADVTLGPKA